MDKPRSSLAEYAWEGMITDEYPVPATTGQLTRTPKQKEHATMLSPTTASDTRRKAHRRQNSTPITEAPYAPPTLPAAIKRINSQRRAHRRGLSMDTAITPTNRTIQPALQSISQDDATVSNIHNPGQQQQQQLQFAQQHELVQPGQNNFDPLQLQTNFPYTQQQQFPSHTHSASQFQAQTMSAPGDMSQFSPFQQSLDLQQPMTPSSHIMQDQFFPATPQTHHTGMSPQLSSQAFQAPMAPPMERASSLMSQQGPPSPSKQQMDDLRDHVEALYGKGVSINIGVLPTPVATPSKRSCVSDKIDASPIPFSLSDGPEVNFAPAPSVDILASMDRSLSDKGYVSPVFSPAHMSPSQSFMGSPVLASSNGFDAALASSDIVFGEDTLTSFVGSPPGVLTDGEASSPQSNSTHFSSSSRTPKPTSLANHNINGCIKPTGIDPELISVYISEQDPVTHKWKCLHPGCRHPWFGRRENIRAHVQTHLGDRQFMCNVCNKRFVRQHDLKRHAKIHMGVKDYVCLCGSTFARMDALTRHRQRGMCSGGFPGAVRSEKKRGRPKKHRPELDARASKAAAQRARNAAHRRADSDDFSSSAASSPGSVASPEPLLHGTDFASLDDAASSPRGDGPAAADLALPLVTSSMEAASLDGPTALGASTLSGGPAPDLAGDTSFDMSTLLSAEPGVAGAAAMQRSSSGDSADSYTTIFDSPVWDGHGGAAAGAPADATGAPAALAFDAYAAFTDSPSPTDVFASAALLNLDTPPSSPLPSVDGLASFCGKDVLDGLLCSDAFSLPEVAGEESGFLEGF